MDYVKSRHHWYTHSGLSKGASTEEMEKGRRRRRRRGRERGRRRKRRTRRVSWDVS